jgi:site-specific recombinase XerD
MRAPQIGFDQLVQDFFVRRLIGQRGASPRTIESYRDAFELLFGYLEQRLSKAPSKLSLADLDAPMILDFLDHLETVRHNSARTRNARLAAVHSFMRYAAVRDPASLAITARVLAIPAKRFDRPVLGYLTRDEITAVLAAPDRRTWSGQRDAVLLAVAYNTGARVSELTCSWNARLPCSYTAKAANSGSSRCGPAPLPACAPGSAGSAPGQKLHCSPTGTGRR